MWWIVRSVAAAAVIVLIVAGCGDDNGQQSSSTTGTDEGVAAAERVESALSEAYSAEDAALLRPVLADDVTFSDPTFDDEVQGADEVEDFIATWFSTWDEPFEPEFVVADDGSYIVGWGVWAGSGPLGEFSTPVLEVDEVVDGEIASITIYYADPDLPESVLAAFPPLSG